MVIGRRERRIVKRKRSIAEVWLAKEVNARTNDSIMYKSDLLKWIFSRSWDMNKRESVMLRQRRNFYKYRRTLTHGERELFFIEREHHVLGMSELWQNKRTFSHLVKGCTFSFQRDHSTPNVGTLLE